MFQRILLLLLLLPRLGWSQIAQADAYRYRAETLCDAGKNDQALYYYEKAYQLVRTADPVRAASLCVDISSVSYTKEHYRWAADRCLTGLGHLKNEAIKPDTVLVKLYSSLGIIYKKLYQNDSARYYFRQADELLVRNPRIEAQIPYYVLYHYNNQGNWFFKTGQYPKSIAYLNKAGDMARRFNFTDEITYIESNLAGCYDATNQPAEALKHSLLAHKFYGERDIRGYGNLAGIGWTLHKLQRYPEALTYFDRADRLLATLRIEEGSLVYTPELINLRWMQSTCLRSANRQAEARRTMLEGIYLHNRQLGATGVLLAKLRIEQGLLAETENQPFRSIEDYQAAVRAVCPDPTRLEILMKMPESSRILDEATLLTALWHKARLQKKQYDRTQTLAYLNAAVTDYGHCIRLKQRLSQASDADNSRLMLSDKFYELLPESIGVFYTAYCRQPSPFLREALFNLFGQVQASSLNEALRQRFIKQQALPQALLNEEEQLRRQMHALRNRPNPTAQTAADLNDCEIRWHQLVAKFRQDYPAYYQLTYAETTADSRALQRQLDDKAAHLSYVQHKNDLYVLVVTRHDMAVVRQPVDQTRFRQHAERLRQHLYQDPVLSRYDGMADAAFLYRYCVEPVRRWIATKDRLVIARDANLTFLPFEVLETGRQARDYLANHYAISYALMARPALESPQPTPVLHSVLVVAPFVKARRGQRAATSRGTFRTLLSSEAQARAIGGDLLLGTNASKQAFLRTDLTRDVIYFATHAQTDDAEPANSYIAFSPDSNDRLHTEEIYDLPLTTTRLAVLGACATGHGKVVKGEGLLSLARAFAYAGCPSVVATLWEANDETTAYLSVRLHHHLSKGLAIDKALQLARTDFFDSPLARKYDHPYYWANFVLIGRYDPVLSDQTPAGLLGGSAFMLLLSGLLWRRRTFTRLLHFHKNRHANQEPAS